MTQTIAVSEERRTTHRQRSTVVSNDPKHRRRSAYRASSGVFPVGESELTRKLGGIGRRLELSIAFERLERFERPRLLIQHMIAERLGGLDEGFGEPRSRSDPGEDRD
jgi:hypothetical protein